MDYYYNKISCSGKADRFVEMIENYWFIQLAFLYKNNYVEALETVVGNKMK